MASRPRRARVGDSVRVEGLPPDLAEYARETRRIFRLAVGHQFKVRGRNRIGWLELWAGRVVGEQFFMHSIWIEPELVRVVRRRPPSPTRR